MWPSEAHPVFGGFVARNVDALRRCGADVEVIANEDPHPGAVSSTLKYARLLRRVRAGASGRSYDAVIGHYLYPTAAIARVAARSIGSPLVLVVHGTDVRSVHRKDPFAWAARRALRSADLVVTVSRALARTVRDDLGVPESIPVVPIHMGIDEDVFVPDPHARRALGLAATERIILFVGNLVPTKGIDVLQAAFERLVADNLADRLVIVGCGSLEGSVRRWAENADVAGLVTLTGYMEQQQVAQWMAAADVLALPSRNEGLGLVLLEAMACGTPCVASKVGGVPEVLTGKTGVLVEPGDADALAKGLAHVLAEGPDTYRERCIAAARGHGTRTKAAELLEAIGSACV